MDQLEKYGKDVNRSLSRSLVRRKVLLFLASRDSGTIAEITLATKSNYTNVRLAIEGDDTRYNVKLSLIELGLVMRINMDGYCIYRITPMGITVASSIVEEGHDRDNEPVEAV